MTDTVHFQDTTDVSAWLKAQMAGLPYMTGDLEGLGGRIKAEADHFRVKEILPYAPCGQGEHVYITLRRAGWNTADVASRLKESLGVSHMDVGWAGRKDKNAVTTQTFSVQQPLRVPLAQIADQLAPLPFDILNICRHGNKLKTGHVKANRFQIVLSQIDSNVQLSHARRLTAAIRQRGLPNFYGQQRFGRQMGNIEQGLALLRRKGRSMRRKKNMLMVSALQSALFNLWLKERIQTGGFETIRAGDVVQKTDTGGMFTVEDVKDAADRFAARQIVYTGPIYGYKMRRAQAEAGQAEAALLSRCHLDLEDFKPVRAAGTRRHAVLRLPDLNVRPHAQGLEFDFVLPAGAYATVVMRELMKTGQGSTPSDLP